MNVDSLTNCRGSLNCMQKKYNKIILIIESKLLVFMDSQLVMYIVSNVPMCIEIMLLVYIEGKF